MAIIHCGRRLSSRLSRVYRPAKLIVDGRDFLCIVRDVSAGGVNVQLFHDLPEHRTLAIEFDNGDRHSLRKAWQTADRMGCAFLDPVDVTSIISAEGRDHPRRHPRLQVEHDAFLYSDGARTRVVLRDISHRGAAVDADALLKLEALVRIESPVLPPVHAKVRWRRHPRYGLIFEQTFSMAEVARMYLAM